MNKIANAVSDRSKPMCPAAEDKAEGPKNMPIPQNRQYAPNGAFQG